jgi:cytochrome b pre-mRNA-processing protein 3
MIRIPFFKPRENPIAALYGDIVAASRAPEAYRSFGVADDFESRFERLVLVMTLALRRMRALGAPAEGPAQLLVDQFFADLDDGLRKAGVSDLAVGKRVKKLAQGFYGRAEAYTEALDAGEDALRQVLARNLMSGRLAPEAIHPGLLAEIETWCRQLEGADLAALMAGGTLSGAR